jgi:MFS family permease
VAKAGRTVILVGLVAVLVGTVLAAVAVHLVPGHDAGWATAGPLLVAGVGSGLVIAPNQSLALADVPLPRAGTAGGILQTGQRLGSSLGIACVSAVFFGRLGAGHDWAGAFQMGLVVALGFEAAALCCALADRRGSRKRSDGKAN